MTINETLEEIEVKIKIPQRLPGLLSGQEAPEDCGFKKVSPRSLELNTLFDHPDRRIYTSGCTIRLRTYGTRHILTWKGPVKPDSLSLKSGRKLRLKYPAGKLVF